MHVEPAAEDEWREEPEPGSVPTEYFRAANRTILTSNDSPDVGFSTTINPYNGCSHGCIYCYARPYHEYWGFSSGLDFEAKILVKQNAAELLRRELMKPRWQPRVIGFSGVTDAYQPGERDLRVTRSCLEVLAEFRNPVSIFTKSRLVTRDMDLLVPLAQLGAASVSLSLTTLNADLARRMEPRASVPQARLDAMSRLAAAGIPTGVMVAPVIPGLTDHEILPILKAAAQAGATYAWYSVVRLPHGVADIFSDWLERQMPGSKAKVMRRICELHGGQPDCANFGARMHGQGSQADQITQVFEVARARAGLAPSCPELSSEHFRRPQHGQLSFL